jgi:hypothetical protein
MKISLLVAFLFFLIIPPNRAQETSLVSGKTSPVVESRVFFPHNWIRGYTDFGVAPPHNEPDLGRCVFPQSADAGGANSGCTAYARYLFSGYLEIQPIGRTFARHLVLFFEPIFSFGRNIPEVSYGASMEPMGFDRSIGFAIQLPKGFQFRASQHQFDYLGRYSKYLGRADLRTNGPYGLYATVGVRWTFGGYTQVGRTY